MSRADRNQLISDVRRLKIVVEWYFSKIFMCGEQLIFFHKSAFSLGFFPSFPKIHIYFVSDRGYPRYKLEFILSLYSYASYRCKKM